jgi:hypothetical protein
VAGPRHSRSDDRRMPPCGDQEQPVFRPRRIEAVMIRRPCCRGGACNRLPGGCQGRRHVHNYMTFSYLRATKAPGDLVRTDPRIPHVPRVIKRTGARETKGGSVKERPRLMLGYSVRRSLLATAPFALEVSVILRPLAYLRDGRDGVDEEQLSLPRTASRGGARAVPAPPSGARRYVRSCGPNRG